MASPAVEDKAAGTAPVPNAGLLPETTTNVFAWATFGWMNPVFLLGRKQPLDFQNMYTLDSRFDAENLAMDFHKDWLLAFEKHKADWASPQLDKKGAPKKYEEGSTMRKLIWDKYALHLFGIGWMNMVSSGVNCFSPFVMSYLLTYIANKAYDIPGTDKSVGMAALLLISLFLTQVITTFTNAHFFRASTAEGIQLRAALSSLIYRKTLKLSSAARQEFNSGRIMTLVATDTTRVEQFIMFSNLGWTSPVTIVIIIGFLISKIGPSALVGVATLVAATPIQMYLFKNLSTIRRTVAPITDKRIKMTTEVFSGIRLLKFFSWETPFLETIEKVRRDEIAQVLKKSLFSAFAMTVAFAIPVLACGFAFVAYGAINGGSLDAAAVFPALTWFSMLRFPLMFLPNIISSYADFKVALQRIEKLFMAPELDEQPAVDANAPYAVSVRNGEFIWEASTTAAVSSFAPATVSDKKDFIISGEMGDSSPQQSSATSELSDVSAKKSHLHEINMDIPKGKLVAIVGAVGSGKSSLLNAIIGEMKKVNGSVTFNSSLGYAPQTAWIQNASVKDNILFGLPYNRERYLRAIRDCALESDLKVLPNGDQTSIGERGINLSGGQKQRVNLARLVYFNADIVLMDDPLSAVDAHVGRYLFENCILGALKDKTRILVTHQLHFLSRADHIVVMRDGTIIEQGAYQDLIDANNEFSSLIRNYGSMDEKREEIESQSPSDDANVLEKMDTDMNKHTAGKDIMQVEERDTGAVTLSVWQQYATACGGVPFALWTFFFLALLQAAQVINNLWLTWWSEKLYDNEFNTQGYIGIYVALGIAQCIFTYTLNAYFAFACTRAATVLHERAMKRVIRAKTLFFDTTPLGRIMNRFSKDQDNIDNALPDAFRMFLSTLANAIATFALIIYATPYFAIVLVPVLYLYYLIQALYRSTSRELKRLDSISRSPLYANFGATLAGLPTIRAYGEQERFIATTDNAINGNNSPYYMLILAQRWLAVRLESLGAVLVLAAAVFGVVAYKTIQPALLGLSL
ncbi:hypothetical protein HDU82_006042, partial [Entophlyctis luteolus]